MNSFEKLKKKEEIISIEQSLDIAQKLLKKYKPQIDAQIAADVDNLGGMVMEDYQDSIEHFLDLIPPEDREHYSGHGVTRGDAAAMLAAGLNIMANKSISGDAGPIDERGQFCAFTRHAKFLILSHFDKPLKKLMGEGENKKPIYNKEGSWEAEIGAIVVNTHFYSMVEEFRKMYPGVNIIKANQLPEFFKGKKVS